MTRRPRTGFDPELADLPAPERWRTWMGRVEAVIFAAPQPVARDALARLVGRDCNLDLLLADIRDELRPRPYDLVRVAGGWSHRTRPVYAAAIRAAAGRRPAAELSAATALVLTAIAYLQPVTRGELGQCLGRAVSRDTIAHLRSQNLVAAGPRSPQPGAPATYVTTPAFLGYFGLDSLRDLPDIEQLEDAGLLGKVARPIDGVAPDPIDDDDV